MGDSVQGMKEKLLQRATDVLQRFGGDIPAETRDLEDILTSAKVTKLVHITDPYELLELSRTIRGHDISTEVTTQDTKEVSVETLGEALWGKAQYSKRVHAASVVYSVYDQRQPSNEATEMIKAANTFLHRQNRNEGVFDDDLILEKLHRFHTLSDAEIQSRVIAPLQGRYMSISGDGKDAKITYHIPADFSILYVQQLEKLYNSTILELVTASAPQTVNRWLKEESNGVMLALAGEINKSIKDMQENCQSRLRHSVCNSAVDALHRGRTQSWGSNKEVIKMKVRMGFKHQSHDLQNSKGGQKQSIYSHGKAPIHWGIPTSNRACFAPHEGAPEEWCKDLCAALDNLDLQEVPTFPTDLTPEAMYVILRLEKMHNSKPKTLGALVRVLQSACKVVYVTSPLFLTEEASGKKKSQHDIIPVPSLTFTRKRKEVLVLKSSDILPQIDHVDVQQPSGSIGITGHPSAFLSMSHVDRGSPRKRKLRRRPVGIQAKRAKYEDLHHVPGTTKDDRQLAQLQSFSRIFFSVICEALENEQATPTLADLVEKRQSVSQLERMTEKMPHKELQVDGTEQPQNAGINDEEAMDVRQESIAREKLFEEISIACLVKSSLPPNHIVGLLEEKGIIKIKELGHKVEYNLPPQNMKKDSPIGTSLMASVQSDVKLIMKSFGLPPVD